MNDPFTPVGVSSSSVKLVSQSKEADSAAIHDVSFFLCYTAEDVGLRDCAFNIFHKHCFHTQNNLLVLWCSVLKIVGVSVERMKGGRGKIYDKQVVGCSSPKACK